MATIPSPVATRPKRSRAALRKSGKRKGLEHLEVARDPLDDEVRALDDRRGPLVRADADAHAGVELAVGQQPVERVPGVEVGGVVAAEERGPDARAGAQLLDRLTLVDRHGRADLHHLAAPVGDEAGGLAL